jgi:hypothetical protein
MLFKSRKMQKIMLKIEFFTFRKIFLLFVYLFFFCRPAFSDMIDRIVAYVDDKAITYSEVKETYELVKKTVPDITVEEVINSLINRQLLIDDAKDMRLEAANEDEMIKLYIDIKIGSLIFIKEEDISDFYNKHISEFEGKDFFSVRDEIERYLFHLEMNKRLKEHIEDLRSKKEIKIFIKDL